jgi:hypothetical protein
MAVIRPRADESTCFLPHRFDARIALQSSSHSVILVLEAVLIIGLYEGVVALITKLTSRSHPQ